jgi:hypothetical protein
MTHDQDRHCLDDSLVVDTSITPFSGWCGSLKSA